MHEFHPSNVSTPDSKFRNSLRYKPSFSGDPAGHFTKMHGVLTAALEKHKAESLSRENFEKVTKHMEESEHWKGMPEDARTDFVNALKNELDLPIQEQETV